MRLERPNAAPARAGLTKAFVDDRPPAGPSEPPPPDDEEPLIPRPGPRRACARSPVGARKPAAPTGSPPGLTRAAGAAAPGACASLAVTALLLVALGGLASAPAQAGHLVKPTNLEASAAAGFVSLYWTQTDPTALSQDTPSEFQYGEHPDGALTSTTIWFRGQTRSYAISGLKGGTTYRFRIRAASYTTHAAGPWSDWVTATTQAFVPGVPELRVAPEIDDAAHGGYIGDRELRSEFCGRFPEYCPPDGLAAAAFEDAPLEHDGVAPVALRVHFSAAPGAGGRAPTRASFEVRGGRVKAVERVEAGLWRVRVKPASWRDVGVRLVGGRGCGEAGAVCAAGGRALSNSPSVTIGGPARIRVEGGRAREGRDASVDFAVSLNRAAAHAVSVDYATADGTARAGADYTHAEGTLTFAPGETEKTVAVALLDDAIDEGKEKFTLVLSNPRGAFLRAMHRKTVGVIVNSDPLQAMWLARFGRMVASDAVGAVTARFDTPRDAGSHLTLAGQRLDLSGEGAGDGQALADAMTGLARAFGAEVTPAADDPFAQPRLADPWNDPTAGTARSMTGRELLLGTSFRAVLGQGAGSQWTSWGQGASVSHFSAAVPGLDLTGESATGSMGMDYERGRLLAGFAMTHSVGEGTARDSGWRYALGSTATMMVPYGRFALTERISAWGLAGTGSGRLTLDLDGAVAQRYRTDLAMTLAAAGVRGELLTPTETGGFALALKADAFWVRTESDAVRASAFGGLMGARGDSSRVRAVLDGSRTFALTGGATLAPKLELGVRHDGGDAETGTGLEFGAGLGYADPSRGLDMALRVHGLAVHAEDGYGEWGVSGQLRLVPGGAGRGLSASLTPSFGVDPSGTERLWALPASSGLAANGEAVATSRLDAELGYGLPVFGGGFTGTPNVGFGLSEAARDLRLGWRLTSGAATGFELNLDAVRRAPANGDDAEHGVRLTSTLRW